ncbi:MAG: hypothetical protein K0S74_1341 [Chlamydiales bacterium]|jgi:hypothetical protein|nr:hypothetical protein [Chlamydiales bacterium]
MSWSANGSSKSVSIGYTMPLYGTSNNSTSFTSFLGNLASSLASAFGGGRRGGNHTPSPEEIKAQELINEGIRVQAIAQQKLKEVEKLTPYEVPDTGADLEAAEMDANLYMAHPSNAHAFSAQPLQEQYKDIYADYQKKKKKVLSNPKYYGDLSNSHQKQQGREISDMIEHLTSFHAETGDIVCLFNNLSKNGTFLPKIPQSQIIQLAPKTSNVFSQSGTVSSGIFSTSPFASLPLNYFEQKAKAAPYKIWGQYYKIFDAYQKSSKLILELNELDQRRVALFKSLKAVNNYINDLEDKIIHMQFSAEMLKNSCKNVDTLEKQAQTNFYSSQTRLFNHTADTAVDALSHKGQQEFHLKWHSSIADEVKKYKQQGKDLYQQLNKAMKELQNGPCQTTINNFESLLKKVEDHSSSLKDLENKYQQAILKTKRVQASIKQEIVYGEVSVEAQQKEVKFAKENLGKAKELKTKLTKDLKDFNQNFEDTKTYLLFAKSDAATYAAQQAALNLEITCIKTDLNQLKFDLQYAQNEIIEYTQAMQYAYANQAIQPSEVLSVAQQIANGSIVGAAPPFMANPMVLSDRLAQIRLQEPQIDTKQISAKIKADDNAMRVKFQQLEEWKRQAGTSNSDKIPPHITADPAPSSIHSQQNMSVPPLISVEMLANDKTINEAMRAKFQQLEEWKRRSGIPNSDKIPPHIANIPILPSVHTQLSIPSHQLKPEELLAKIKADNEIMKAQHQQMENRSLEAFSNILQRQKLLEENKNICGPAFFDVSNEKEIVALTKGYFSQEQIAKPDTSKKVTLANGVTYEMLDAVEYPLAQKIMQGAQDCTQVINDPKSSLLQKQFALYTLSDLEKTSLLFAHKGEGFYRIDGQKLEKPTGSVAVLYVNGMSNVLSGALETASFIHKQLKGHEVYGCFFDMKVSELAAIKMQVAGDKIALLTKNVKMLLTQYETIELNCHSLGVEISKQVLSQLDLSEKQRITVTAYGGATIIPKYLGGNVTNYICNTDWVPGIVESSRVAVAIRTHGKKDDVEVYNVLSIMAEEELFSNQEKDLGERSGYSESQLKLIEKRTQELLKIHKQNEDDKVKILIADSISHSILGTVYTEKLKKQCDNLLEEDI